MQRITGLTLAAALGAISLWLCRFETWLVLLIMTATALRLAVLFYGSTDAPRRAWAMGATYLGVGLATALAMHLMMARMLGGFVRLDELAWSTLFYAGAIAALDSFDAALKWSLRKWSSAMGQSLVRLVVILLLVPPAALATLQVVRVKPGYTLPDAALALQPHTVTLHAADGLPLRAYYFDRGHPTTVIVSHGLGAHSENFMPYLLTILLHHKVNGLILDLRAHGYSAGHTCSFGHHEQHDMAAAVTWLRDNHTERSERLIFYGFSMGSAAVLPVAADTPQTIGVIVDSGFARLTDTANAMLSGIPKPLLRVLMPLGLGIASALAETPLWDVVPERDMARLDVPVRIVHGLEDMMIPASQGERLMQHRTATGRLIPGGQHTSLPNADTDYFRYIGRFIDRLLNPPDSDTPDDPGPTLGPG